MSHDDKRFKAENWANLRRESRLEQMPPNKVFNHITLKQKITVADIGCGPGAFSIPIADYIKSVDGVLYAIDVAQEMLKQVKIYAESKGLDNIKYFQTLDDKLNLQMNFDVAILINVLHEFEGPEKYLSEIWEHLNPQGYIIIIDHDRRKSPDEGGPPDHHRIPLDKAIEYVSKLSKNIESIKEFYPNKYMLKVFK